VSRGEGGLQSRNRKLALPLSVSVEFRVWEKTYAPNSITDSAPFDAAHESGVKAIRDAKLIDRDELRLGKFSVLIALDRGKVSFSSRSH
jgi:hypothetical protein